MADDPKTETTNLLKSPTNSPLKEKKSNEELLSKPEGIRKLKSIVKEKLFRPKDKEKENKAEKNGKTKKGNDNENDDEEESLDLEFDSYVYLGVVLPDFILIFYKIMSTMIEKIIKKDQSIIYSICQSPRFIFTRMAKISLFFILLIPGLLVPFIQIVVIGSFDKGNLDLDLIDYNKKLLSVAKIFMIFMFSCMALKECSNALKNWLHTIFYMKRLEQYSTYFNVLKNKEKPIDSGFKISYYLSKISCFLPGLSQLSVSLFIENYSTYIIVNCGTTVELIANFAGLYVILEFDNLMIDFLKTTYLDQAMVKFVKYIVEIMKEYTNEGDLLTDLERSIKKMFKSDVIEIKGKKAKKYGITWIFEAHKIMIWITLLLQFTVVAMTFVSFEGKSDRIKKNPEV